ncbi:SRPBCC family protein [Roseibium suaedae]|uniref:Uncharacterized conserved protein YndB, AHSA1/START domain n=1 Tax=Roseibium suaedae TaxID=735517 RepID=A0A1M7HFG9_9HYPH|nr:SRPBCC family protein [Roseibium suaedae]SHM27236.1 Uncharacterized conserved protein YndB, AHSA1/START domain [Roseibium suaedae]
MTDTAVAGDYGMLTEPATLKIQRLLPGPLERVWNYLTDDRLRATWLAAGPMTLEKDAAFTLTWRNDNLSKSPAQRPDGFPEEHSMDSRILEVHAPYRLIFTWGERGEVCFDLEEQDGKVLLTVVHKRISDRANTVMIGAGWHRHLEVLADRLDGREPDTFWAGWLKLRAEYDQRLPA